MKEELEVYIYIKDKNGKKYKDSNYKEIDNLLHKINKFEGTNIQKFLKQKYDVYKSILKEGSMINIQVLKQDVFSNKVLFTYDGEKLREL